MATTTNGIYYPNDYDSVADIPADMKKIAESVDTKISENKTEINNIKTEQTTQNTNISNLQKDNTTNKQDITNIKAKDTEQDKYIAELEAENTRLRQDLNGLPKGQASGESIDLNDSAEMRCELKISGNSEQETREGYNKLPIKFANATNNGITLTVKDNGKLLLNGTSTSTALFNAVLDNEISLNNYIFKIKKNSGTISANSVQFFLYTTGYTSNQNISVTPTLSSSKTTLSSNAYTVERIVIPAETTLTNVELEVMISETEKQYEPYGASPSPDYPSEVECCGDNGSINEVICNKNLWNINYSGTKQAITYNLSKNKITLNGTSNGLGDVFNTKNYSTFFLKAGTYTINVKVISGSFTAGTNDMALYFKKKSDDKNFVSLYKGINYTAKGTITFTEDDEVYVYSFVNGSNVIFNNLVIEIQMEEGSTATSYEEHQSQSYTIPTQQPMRAIGDTRDTFILKENGKWYERHKVNRYIFTGNENWRKSSNTNNNIFYLQGIFNTLINKGISNYFIYRIVWNIDLVGIEIYDNKNIRFGLGLDSNITSVEEWKEYLQTQYNAGTPVYVDYILETPTDIECTEEQSTILFDIEQNAKTYDKVTHMYSTDNVSPVIDVTYKKDIETLFANTLVEGV